MLKSPNKENKLGVPAVITPEHPLVIAFKMCQGLGKPGEWIWQTQKAWAEDKEYPWTMEQRLTYLKKAIANQRMRLQTGGLDKWLHIPVDIETFISCPSLMNKRTAVWPEVMPFLEEINDGTRSECVLTGGIGVAKCLSPETPVLMFDGHVKKAKNVVIGDRLMGPDSSPRNVKSVATGQDQMYRVRQKGGDDYVVNGAHILSLQYTDTSNVKASGLVLKRYGRVKGDILNITVEEYVQLTPRHRGLLKGWKPDAVGFGGEPVYDPYLLGVWLGDGSSHAMEITSMDAEIVDYFKGVGKREFLFLHEWDQPDNKSRGYRLSAYERGKVNVLLEWLKGQGLQHNKHIPHAYKTAPLGDRLALLAGLMDTDAHLTKTGCFVISQVRKRLADDIAFVARSCGFRVTQTEDTINGTIYHRSFISGATSQIPTRLQRKQAAPRRQVKEINRWGVTVEALGIGDYCGFELEGPDRLFLLGDFTVTHNTTIAIYTQAFQTYLLSAASHPHKDLDLDPSSEILTVFQSLSKNLAADVDYRRFRDMIANAPYFAEYFPFNKDRESELSFPRRIIVKPVAGHDQAAIGQNVIGGILDEINFMAVVEKSKMTMDSSIYDQAMSNYNAIASRRASRFAILGEVPGMLCLVSSRNYPGQFTDQKEKEAKTNKRIYVYDMVLWKLRPKRFAGTTFRVFVGDATRRPRIMPDDEQISDEDRRLVQDVPTEYKDNFSRDILVALREVAGVSTIAMHPFIPDTTAIAECFLPNQFSILSRTECDFADTRPLIYPKRFLNPSYPRFVHGDIALSGDNYGLAIGHVPGFKEVKRSDTVTEMMPIIYYDALLRIQAPRGGEIELENPRRLLYALRENGLNIKWVTFDSYQSSDSIQLLRQRNFVVGLQSMDEKPTPYSITKQAFYDRRIRSHLHERAQTELAQLEQDQKTRKIDHSPHGSKDVSDAMAGVCYGLTMRRDIWRMFNIPLRQIPRSIVEAENDGKMSLAADEKRDIRFGGRRGYEEIAVG